MTNEHFVQFYDSENYLVSKVAAFVRAGLHSGESVIVIATPRQRTAIGERLNTSVSVVDDWSRRYQALDAAATLAQFMVNGRVDEKRFVDLISTLLKRAAASGNGGVRVFGDLVGVLWAAGEFEATIKLEMLWNTLALSHAFSLYCAYGVGSFPREAHSAPFERICNEHSAIAPAESYQAPANAFENARMIALFQQKALALENEVAYGRDLQRRLQVTEQALAALCARRTKNSAVSVERRHHIDIHPAPPRVLSQCAASLDSEPLRGEPLTGEP